MREDTGLLFYLKPYKKRFVLALLFMAMVALFTAVLALIIQPVMDELSMQSGANLSGKAKYFRELLLGLFNIREQNLKFILPQLLFLTFLGQAIFNFFSLYLMKTLGLKVVRDIRDQLYKNLVHQSIDFLSKSKTGDLVSRITNDIEKIKFAVSETLSVYVRESLTLVVLLFVVFFQDWFMALLSFTILPVAGSFLVVLGKQVKKRGIQSQVAIGRLSSFLSETIMGNKIVKAYNMENYELDKFAALNQDHYRINSKIAMVYSLSSPIMNIIGGLVAGVIFAVGMHRVADGRISLGQFTSFLAALFLLYNPLKRLSQANNDYQQGKAGHERVVQIIKHQNPIKDSTTAKDIKHIRGQIEYRDVSFSYTQDIPVLKNVSFTVQPNQLVALVGASGSGKTTIMNLLLRFYDPNSGQIFIDGRDIRDITIRSLRDSIGLVTQDVFLFNDTVARNIAYGNTQYTSAEIEAAAEIARASDFIEKLPDKYNTIVGERGIFLSNGQRQRLSIARAVLKKPAVLVFDEATSSLDTESEKLIQAAMEEVMHGRTTLVIAHRLSTIIEADNILVIEKGIIKESGNHRKLLRKKGLYHSLYNLQFPEMDIIM